MPLDHTDKQGGKKFGMLKTQQEKDLEEINTEYVTGDAYKDVEDLDDKLRGYKETFMKFDEDHNGSLDLMELKKMMEVMGQAKTHLELKKMIAEVDTTNLGVINYRDFVDMMLGPKTTVLKLILLFEEKIKQQSGQDRPKGLPRKKSLADLP